MARENCNEGETTGENEKTETKGGDQDGEENGLAREKLERKSNTNDVKAQLAERKRKPRVDSG